MKYGWKIWLFSLLAIPALSQNMDETEREPEARKRIEAARAAYITQRLELTTEEAEKFWPVYREFAGKRRELLQQYREVKNSGKNEQELIELQLTLRQQELDLEKEYSDKFLKVIPAEKLVNLRSAEKDFSRIVMRQIQQRKMQPERRQQFRERNQMRK